MRTLDADVLALQEVDRLQPRSQLADLTAVAAAGDGRGVAPVRRRAVRDPRRDLDGRDRLGAAGHGRLRHLTAVPLPGDQLAGAAAAADPGAVPDVAARPAQGDRGARGTAVGDHRPVPTPAGPLVVANTHLSFVPGWGRRQLSRIRRDLAAFADPVVLMGDLNMPSPRPAAITGYRSLAEHPTFPVERRTGNSTTSCCAGEFGAVVGSSAPALPLSDHRALIVELTDPS